MFRAHAREMIILHIGVLPGFSTSHFHLDDASFLTIAYGINRHAKVQ